MSDRPDGLRRAVRRRDAGEPDGDRLELTTTPFETAVRTRERPDGHTDFSVTVRVPGLGAVVDGEVAGIVADGWYDTFRRRIEDVGGLTRGDHDLSPTVTRAEDRADGGGTVTVEFAFDDVDPDRGLDDAAALINFVEGTYVQGVIPGYDYTEPVTELLSRAQSAAGTDGDAGIPPG